MDPESLIPLTPETVYEDSCPKCGASVDAFDFKIPGMWVLAEFRCGQCDCHFFSDLPYGLGVVIPAVLNADTGEAKAKYTGVWYANLTAAAFQGRRPQETAITVERSPRSSSACLVNCLMTCWGDAVSLLLRVNQVQRVSGIDIIVLINPTLRWLVPDSVSGIWIVEQGLGANERWSEALDAEIKAAASRFDLQLFVPVTFQPALVTQAELQQACKVRPFPREEWIERLEQKPVVTFMLRNDRPWPQARKSRSRSILSRVLGRISKQMEYKLNVGISKWQERRQLKYAQALAEELRKGFPKLEFSVCGFGTGGKLPAWIKDLRVDACDGDTNLAWAEQSAQSHVLFGVHGSHLCVFGSLAGAHIELTPSDRLRNILTCASVTTDETREALFCHRFLPGDLAPGYLADVISSILVNYSYFAVAFGDANYTPLSKERLKSARQALARRRTVVSQLGPEMRERFEC